VALIWGVPLVLLVTGSIGAVSGLFIALLRIPPFIMTLAMGIIVTVHCWALPGVRLAGPFRRS
jgi:ribose/xylose/arabinose/galactoside ABC-type transport system permease subunit